MKRIILILVLLALVLQGSTCNDSNFVFPGNVDSISDAALVDCDAYLDAKFEGHQCLLLVNPFKRAVRIFDVTDNQFILAPVGYFPLAVSVGQIPMRVATLPTLNLGKAFVLDTRLGQIFSINTKNDGQTSSFRSSKAEGGIDVDGGSQQITLAKSGENLWAFVAASESAKIQAISLDLKTGKESNPPTRFEFSSNSASINTLVTDTNSKFLIAADNQGFSVFDIQSTPNKLKYSVKTGLSVSKIIIGKIGVKTNSGEGEKTLILALLPSEKKAVLYELTDTETPPLGSVELAGIPMAGYIPEGARQNCCENSPEPWAAILTDSGQLQYLNLQAIIENRQSKDGKKEDKIGATVSVVETANVAASKTANPIAIIGASTQNEDDKIIQRKMFLIYSNLILSLNEGDSKPIKRIDGN